MHENLREAYNLRLPLLVHVAQEVAAQLSESLKDAQIPNSTTARAINAIEFITKIAELGQELKSPLTEFNEQILVSVTVASLDIVPRLVEHLQEEMTVISSNWVDAPEENSQRLKLNFLVPSWACPIGWSQRRDVPLAITMIVSAVAGLRLAEIDNSPEYHALIMKGGGAKGYAYLGAIEVLQSNYDFNWFIGTSAGAIAAVLLAAGYSVSELKTVLGTKNFRDFFDAKWYSIPGNIWYYSGMHKADSFTSWLDDLLAKKLGSYNRVKLSDLPYRATVYASRRDLEKLKFDSEDCDDDAAYAVRCSMSYPIVFTPQSHQGFMTFDGGIQNNFPVEALLKDSPDTAFISLYLGSETYEAPTQRWAFMDLLSIWTESKDADVIRKFREQTVIIDPRPISTLDFKLSQEERDFLLLAGKAAAVAHVDNSSSGYQDLVKERDRLKAIVTAARTWRQRKQILICTIIIVSIVVLTFLIW